MVFAQITARCLLLSPFVLAQACDRKPAREVPLRPTSPPPSAKNSDQRDLDQFLETERRQATTAPEALSADPPIESQHRTAPRSPDAAAADSGLKFDAPDTWKKQTPSSAMRKAHYILPRAGGDEKDAELILFYFGPSEGGTVDANLARWKGMFVDAKGKALPNSATRVDKIDANGLKVTLLDLTGRYVESNMMTGRRAEPTASDYRMLAAVVETPRGPWFFKAIGPLQTMTAHEASIRAMLETVRF